MKGHRLYQKGGIIAANLPNYQAGVTSPSDQVPFVVGILIPDLAPDNTNTSYVALESIHLYDGIIDGPSMWGLVCQGHVSDLRLTRMTVQNAGALASYYLRPFPTYRNDGAPLGINYVQGGQLMSAGGICLGESDCLGLGPYFFTQNSGVAQARVQNVQLNEVTILDCFSFGLMAQNVTTTKTQDVLISGTYSDDPNVLFPEGLSLGYADTNAEYPSMDGLTVNGLVIDKTNYKGDQQTQLTEGLAAVGILNDRSWNCQFRNVHVSNITTTFLTDQAEITSYGIISASLQNVSYNECQVENVTSTGEINMWHLSGNELLGGGIVSATNVRMDNCKVGGGTCTPLTTNLGGNAVSGFVFFYVKGLRVSNCSAANLVANGQGAYGNCGFQIIDGPLDEAGIGNEQQEDLVFENCSVQRVLGVQGVSCSGFLFDPYDGPGYRTKTVLFDHCTVQGCHSQAGGTGLSSQSMANGFFYQQTAQTESSYAVVYRGCTAQDCQGAASPLSGGFVAMSSWTDPTQANVPVYGHVYEDCHAQYNVNGFSIQNATQMAFRQCHADLNVALETQTSADGTYGSGFLDLGLDLSPSQVGTIDAPLPSTSLFESCRALENGNTAIHTGANGNYNVVYGTSQASATAIPLLQGNLTSQIIPVPVPQAAFLGSGQLLVPNTTCVSITAY